MLNHEVTWKCDFRHSSATCLTSLWAVAGPLWKISSTEMCLMTWSHFNILNGVIAGGRKIAWPGKDNFVSGSSSVITVLINKAGMPLFHLLLIYFRSSASLECATKWVMARYSVRTAHKLCCCRRSLLKRCSLMKHKVPVPPFGKNPPADMYRYALHFTEGCCIGFCITSNKGRNGFAGEITGYFGNSVLFSLSIAFVSPWFASPGHRGSSVPRDEQHFVPVKQLNPRKHSSLRKLWPVTKLVI